MFPERSFLNPYRTQSKTHDPCTNALQVRVFQRRPGRTKAKPSVLENEAKEYHRQNPLAIRGGR